MSGLSIDWDDAEVTASGLETRGHVQRVHLSDMPDERWSRQFVANAMDSNKEPSDRTWLSQPKLIGDEIVVEGLPEHADVEPLRGYLDKLVELTNRQVGPWS